MIVALRPSPSLKLTTALTSAINAGFVSLSDLARRVCGPGPAAVPNIWAIAKPPLFGTPVIGEFSKPGKDCNKACKGWGKTCGNAITNSNKCITQTVTAATKLVVVECANIIDRKNKKLCLMQTSNESKIIKKDFKLEVKEAKVLCKELQNTCAAECLAKVAGAE